MKPRRNKAAAPAAKELGAKTVHLECLATGASAVYVAGTFNNWDAQATPMADSGGGCWAKDLMLAPGRYEYLFVVDGQWLADPASGDAVPNPFGGWNSRLTVT